MSGKRLSVVIPCYMQGNTLLKAMESAFQKNLHMSDELVVVNDASGKDNTGFVLGGFKDHQRQTTRAIVEVVNQGFFPAGVSDARNRGISYAHGELILPLDADDEFLPGAVDALLEAYQPGTAVYGDYLIGDAPTPNADPGMIYRKSVCHATVLFSKEDWLRVGGYKPEFNVGCEDWEFLLSLVEAGVNLTHVNAPIYRKAINPNGRGAKCLERRPLIASLLKEYHPKVQL